jgi:sterol 3beta-glucosyltransferase
MPAGAIHAATRRARASVSRSLGVVMRAAYPCIRRGRAAYTIRAVRISVLALGTRGDTEPFVALAAGLQAARHDVRVATFARFEPLVRGHGLGFLELPGDTSEMFATREWSNLVVKPWNWAAHVRALQAMIEPIVDRLGPEHAEAVCDGADAIVFTSNTTFGYWAAVERGLPTVMAALGPHEPTWEFPHPVLAPGLRLGRLANRLTYVVGSRLAGETLREPIRPRSRRRLGFSPLPLRGTSDRWPPFPVVAGFSRVLLERPRDWPAHVRQTGFWLTRPLPGAAVPAEVEQFLASGPAPVYVSFGSMRPGEGEKLLGEVMEAVRRDGRRALLGSGFGAAADSVEGDDVIAAEELPHALVLPRVSAFVHHGGVGTTARGLTAGLPTLAVPFIYDQSFWGRRVAAIGAGPPPIPRERLTADRLVEAFRTLESSEVRAAARHAGDRLRAEDGVGDAVRIIEECFGCAS